MERKEMEMGVAFSRIERLEELERVQLLAQQIWPETYKEILTEEQISYMMEMMYSSSVLEKEFAEGYSFDLCHVNGNDAGYISFSPYHEEPGTAKLHKVYLQSAFHGYGIGQKMLSYAFERCRKLGFSSVILAVNKQNLKAQKAYERAGFILEKAVCNDIGNGFVMDDYIMRKNFESPQKFPGT